jgi:hypothetical protein
MTIAESAPTGELADLRPPALAAIRGVVARYAHAIRTGDNDELRSAFHPRATLAGYRDDELILAGLAGADTLRPASDRSARTESSYRHELQSVLITGRIATVEIFEYSLDDQDFRTCFHMAWIEGRWQITAMLSAALAPTAEVYGCHET